MLLSQIVNKSNHFLFSVKALVVFLSIVLSSLEKPLLSNTYSSRLKSPQYLPLEAEWCLPNKDCLLLEIADTDYEKSLGLMHRRTLEKGTGMWFRFFPSEIVRFWMFETFIPLDIIFSYKGIIIAIETNVPSCSIPKCPTFGPNRPVDSVIEIAAGEVERLKIKVGDSLEINYLKNRFKKIP